MGASQMIEMSAHEFTKKPGRFVVLPIPLLVRRKRGIASRSIPVRRSLLPSVPPAASSTASLMSGQPSTWPATRIMYSAGKGQFASLSAPLIPEDADLKLPDDKLNSGLALEAVRPCSTHCAHTIWGRSLMMQSGILSLHQGMVGFQREHKIVHEINRLYRGSVKLRPSKPASRGCTCVQKISEQAIY